MDRSVRHRQSEGAPHDPHRTAACSFGAYYTQDTERLTHRVVVAPIGHPTAPGLIAEFSRRYDNPKTRHQYVAELTDLFVCAGRHHPHQRNEADVLR